MPMLLDEIRRACAECAKETAYQSGGQALTFGALWRRACALAAYLRAQGEGPVLVYGRTQPDMITAFLACLLCRRPYVPYDAANPPARLHQTIALARPQLVVAPGWAEIDCAEPLLTGEVLEAVFAGRSAEEFVPAAPGTEAVAYIIFTSGSTGVPKGVPITHGNLENFVRWLGRCPGMEAMKGKTIFCPASFAFDLSVAGLFLMLTGGNTLVCPAPQEQSGLGALLAAMNRANCHMLVATPTFVQWCLQDALFDARLLPRLSLVLFCGEMLPVAMAGQLLERFTDVRVLNCYGPTEATCAVTAVEILREHREGTALPIGVRDCAAVQVCIADPQGRELPEGAWGEIVLRGASVSPGYLGTAEGCVDTGSFCCINGENQYATGDIGRVQAGLLYIRGRADEQLKYKGYRIEPGEIEATIGRICGGAACVVGGAVRRGRVAWLWVCIEGQPTHTSAALRAELGQVLPTHMIPRMVRWVKKFPVTKNGKCDRTKIKESMSHEDERGTGGAVVGAGVRQ